jgi:hypothetical protein
MGRNNIIAAGPFRGLFGLRTEILLFIALRLRSWQRGSTTNAIFFWGITRKSRRDEMFVENHIGKIKKPRMGRNIKIRFLICIADCAGNIPDSTVYRPLASLRVKILLLSVHRPASGGFYIEYIRARFGNVNGFLPLVTATYVGKHVNK